MGLRLVLFTLGFNLLLWLSRATLGERLAGALGDTGAWLASLVAPMALLLIATRLSPTRRDALLFASSLSMAALAMWSG